MGYFLRFIAKKVDLWHTKGMLKKTIAVLLTAVIGLAILGGTTGCKKQAFWAEADAIIRLAADRLNIKLNESVIITVTGYDSEGAYLWDGTRIDLAIENGTLDKTSIELKDGKGEARATANMERGEMKISARSGSSAGDPDPLIIEVGELPDVNRVVASINPPTLPYTGGRVEIAAAVYDSQLEPVEGINVIMETDAGVLDSRGAALRTNSAGQVIDYLETDADATVTIYAADKTATVSVNLDPEPEPNQDPTAAFSFSPAEPASGEKVYFNASASSDPDGEIVQYQWDFGDGKYGTGQKPRHRFNTGTQATKTFTVTLTVWDNNNRSDSVSQNIKVVLVK